MNAVKNRTLLPNLRDEESVLVENAIRLAIDSIINVLSGVNSARIQEHKQMVADRDKDIQRLESSLKRVEHELQLLRRQGCTCELFTNEHSLDPGSLQTAEHLQAEEQSGFEAECMDAEVTTGQQECEMSISLGLFARPPSSQSHDSAPPSFPGRMCLEQACASLSSTETSGVPEQPRQHLPTPPSSLVVKEEPCDIDAVLIKWEMSEDSFREHQETTDGLFQEEESLTVKHEHDNGEFRGNLPVEPDRHQITEGQHLRNRKKTVPMSELPEEAQRLKRAAWRAASRRYYARKVARQQVNPTHSATFHHIPAYPQSAYAQSLSFANKRRTLISHLPEESQIMQREAWRAASRRYYARKTSRHQTQHAQYGDLLHNTESGEPQESERGSNTEGIMCR